MKDCELALSSSSVLLCMLSTYAVRTVRLLLWNANIIYKIGILFGWHGQYGHKRVVLRRMIVGVEDEGSLNSTVLTE